MSSSSTDDLYLREHVECGDRLVEMRKSGSTASARAIPMRWRSPPEHSCGYRPVNCADSPTSSRQALYPGDPLRSPSAIRWIVSPSRIASPAVSRGFRWPRDPEKRSASAVVEPLDRVGPERANVNPIELYGSGGRLDQTKISRAIVVFLTGLSHEAERLTSCHSERDIAHRAHFAAGRPPNMPPARGNPWSDPRTASSGGATVIWRPAGSGQSRARAVCGRQESLRHRIARAIEKHRARRVLDDLALRHHNEYDRPIPRRRRDRA